MANENLDLVVIFNKVCITECSTDSYQGVIFSKSTQTRAQPKLEYISLRSCESPQSMIYFESSYTVSLQYDLFITHSNYSNCTVTNYDENEFSFLYFRKNFEYNTIEYNSVTKYLIYYEDINSNTYSSNIMNCNFLSNNAPDGVIGVNGFILTVQYCVFKGNYGYCFDTNRNTIEVWDSYFDKNTEISWSGDDVTFMRNVYTSTNQPTYNIEFYYTYNCLTLIPMPSRTTIPKQTPIKMHTLNLQKPNFPYEMKLRIY